MAVVFLGLLSIWALVYPGAALACSFHNYKPAKTLVDWLLNGETVVLARPDPDDQFSFKISRFFRGQSDGANIPYLVDSTSRRRLADNPEEGVVFARSVAGDWVRVLYLAADHRVLVNTILQNADDWRSEQFHPERFATFADYQDHPNRDLSRLALQEIDRVPYPMLRTLQVRVPEMELLKSLRNWNDYSYRPINFLLLGLTKSSVARSIVNDQIEIMQDLDNSQNLGAVATALIELEHARAIEKLDRLYLSNRSQPLAKLEAIVEAMAIRNSLGSKETRLAILQALKGFVAERPDGAAMIARHFSTRQDWSFGNYLEDLLKMPDTLTPSSRLVVSVYVAQSRAAMK
ncbi:MAG: hypothetical protein AAGA50_03500 [Pseudomonadota bacterium]